MKRITIFAALFVVIIWFTNLVFAYCYFTTPEQRGTFGDLFGAANSLFSGLAFVGLIVTLLMQKTELELQRIEIRESRTAQQMNARSTKAIAEITFLAEKLNALRVSYSSLEEIKAAFSQTISHKSHMSLKQVEEEMEAVRNKIKSITAEITNKEIK